MTVLFTAKISPQNQERLREQFPSTQFSFGQTRDEIDQQIGDAEVLVTHGGDIDELLITHAENLRWIMVLSAGVDELPFPIIIKRKIIVTNARGIHKGPMAEYVISMLLQVYRQEKTIINNETAKQWDQSLVLKEISGQTMVVVGTGAIGEEVARLAKAFKMKTIGISKSGDAVEYFDAIHPLEKLNSVLPEADFVISVLPSTNETKRLFKTFEFNQMGQHAVFLNMGRGDVLDEADLLAAIQQDVIGHAVIDVFADEPLSKDHPFWREKNITVTPHLSGVSTEYVPRALEIFTENLSRYLADDESLVNKIDAIKGY